MGNNNTFQIIKDNAKVLARLLKFTKGVRASYFTGLFINAFTNLRYSLVIGLSIQWVTDSALKKDWGQLHKAVIFSIVAFAINVICAFFEYYLIETRMPMIGGRIKNIVLERFTRLQTSYHDNNHSGDLQSRLTSDLETAISAISYQLEHPINILSLGVGNIIMISLFSWKMALVCIAFAILAVFINVFFFKSIDRSSREIQSFIGDATTYYSDIINGLPIIKIFNLQLWSYKRYENENKKILAGNLKLVKINSHQSSVNELMNNISTFGILGIGAIFLATGQISPGSLLVITRLAGVLTWAFTGFSERITNISRLLAGAKRIFDILDSPIEEQIEDKAKIDTSVKQVISFEHLSFKYENGQRVLEGFSESINKGETVAIVGPSGSGKSTVVKLIMGFYHQMDEGGRILLYGRDIRDYSLEKRRSLMTYVPQSNYLFSGTIRENIAFGRQDASEEEIIGAAKAAYAHDFIMKLPKGYDTEVGERGSFLSGGERQRIAIARALLKDAPILLLDEPTASLDSESEQEIQKALDVLMKGRTVIVIAHRLSTIQHADRIVVLEGGRTVERGNHEELMGINQRYAYYYKLLYSDN